jgi:RND family efflux transporter MFP subunit
LNERLSNDLASLKIAREENPEAQGAWRGWALGAGISLAIGLGVFWFMGSLRSRLLPREVEVTQVRFVSPAQSSVQVSSTGYVVAQSTSKVGAKILGRVSEVKVKEGSTVKAGDTLVQLEAAEQRALIASGRAKAAAARARAETARANLVETERQYKREKALLEQEATARSTVEDLESRVSSLSEGLKAAEADTSAELANVSQLEVNLANSTVRAPIGGTVVGKPVEVGELVGPATGPVADLADFSSLMVETDVPEARLSVVRPGSPAEVVLDAFAGKRLRGEVAEISPKVNRTKATVIVKVKFVDDMSGILPDMAARVSFLSQPLSPEELKKPATLFVPASAITEREGKKGVFRLEEGHARYTPIRVGAALAGGFELLEGPVDGTRLVAQPDNELLDGASVKEKAQ